ncbi:Multifunctional cytochrome P450 monooxygenase af510 [Sparassis crispa]|uniref:Multifunctional cytochrome P450 monooxygenase af510 n=1 Tax=Sparassis crispa TaxID=139825 RepID=A0A401G7U2_9APHY|nr:Multifunctional cytochrome P450 monooxygenase af510 [Sparassis crispa]GBE78227.1 Multifunctional cytochrome P450 monooxygenase af510 [Sparassis crispa]
MAPTFRIHIAWAAFIDLPTVPPSPSAQRDLMVSFLICFILYAVFSKHAVRHLPLPPGPRTSWFGSVELPKTYPWITYAQWRKTYGDLVYIYVFGNPVVVLNSARVVNDLLEKRSSIYSSRPFRSMVTQLMGWDWLFSTIPYGPWWKKHRAMFHQHFNAANTSTYHPVMLRETRVLLRNLTDSPDNLDHHIRRNAAAIVLSVAYGHQVAPEGDPYVLLADQAMNTLGLAGIFGTYLVDYIPPLRFIPAWMPGAGFKRQALEWRKLNQAMLNAPFKMVKERMASGNAIPCITAAAVEEWLQSGRDPEQEKVIKGVAATSYAAGADTTVSAVLSFFLAMTVYPEVLERAQAEIDKVVGRDRLPDFSDRDSLPYIDWIVWECLRWNPVTPLGIAHSLTEDDVYEGKLIPKDTTVIPNTWAILHDEATYPEPYRFFPERYADNLKNTELGINEPPLAAFGYGRRICPGRWLATDSVWIAVATVAAAFNIAKALDEKGVPIEPEVEYTSTLLSHPKHFQCSIVQRSDAAAALIAQTSDE